MIYHLFKALKAANLDFPGIDLMDYISVRAIAASVTALLVAVFAGKAIIHRLQRAQIGEEIRDLGLEGQMEKKGTPTMGGLIIILSILCGVLLFTDLTNIYNIMLIITMLWLGGLGFIDDYIKVFKHKKEGMSEHSKLLGQIVLGFAVAVTVCFGGISIWEKAYPDSVDKANPEVRGTIELTRGVSRIQYDKNGNEVDNDSGNSTSTYYEYRKSTKTTIPFVKKHEFNYEWLSPFGGKAGRICKWAIYVLMIVIVITACSNGTNLTDGLDGLATGTSALVGVVVGLLGWVSSSIMTADYLDIMFIPRAGEVMVFMSAFVGALIGFLWYNSYPAQVFMGDTGSLAIGGIIGVGAVLIRKELFLIVLCGVFLVESLSVLMQRAYFKYTKRRYGQGRRIFRMTPLHHHYQKEGVPALIQKPAKALPEAKITVRFWIVGIILAVAALGLLKLR